MQREELIAHYNKAVEFMNQVRAATTYHNTTVKSGGEVPIKEAMNTVIAMLGPLTDTVTELAQCVSLLIDDTKGLRL